MEVSLRMRHQVRYNVKVQGRGIKKKQPIHADSRVEEAGTIRCETVRNASAPPSCACPKQQIPAAHSDHIQRGSRFWSGRFEYQLTAKTMQRAQFVPCHYYHIYNRGVNRETIFFCHENWVLFLKKLHQYFDGTHAYVVAYCLMPTHYHLLINAETGEHRVRRSVMQPFATAYTKSVNTRQERVGPLFQGPFGIASGCKRSSTCAHLSRYIHRNPTDAGLDGQRPSDWQFSSYRDYLDMRNGTLPHPKVVFDYSHCTALNAGHLWNPSC